MLFGLTNSSTDPASSSVPGWPIFLVYSVHLLAAVAIYLPREQDGIADQPLHKRIATYPEAWMVMLHWGARDERMRRQQ
ncbi:hypothetical protein L209DRAFT_758163 [Thermothelomyces heterothallicus CBS 203.75]